MITEPVPLPPAHCYFCHGVCEIIRPTIGLKRISYSCNQHPSRVFHVEEWKDDQWQREYVCFEGQCHNKDYEVFFNLDEKHRKAGSISEIFYVSYGVGEGYLPYELLLAFPFLANWTPENINNKLLIILTFS